MENLPILQGLPDEVRMLILRALALALAFLIIWLLRRVITSIIMVPIRSLINRTASKIDNRIFDAIRPSINMIVISVSFVLAANIILPNDVWFVNLIGVIARVLIIFAVIQLLYKMVDYIAPSSVHLMSMTGVNVEERLMPFIRVGAKVTIIAVGATIILQELGYDVSALIAGLGIGGLGLSLAAQDTVANLFGFVSIVADSPFDVGDYIVTPNGEGIVEHVGIRSTNLRQLDQAVVSIPNNQLANNPITNWSRLSKRRLDFMMGVTYATEISQMQVLLDRVREMLARREKVDPESVVVYFQNFGASSLDVLVRCYIFIADWAEFQAEKELINLEIMGIVDELGLSMAFPSQSLYIENLPTMAMDALESAGLLEDENDKEPDKPQLIEPQKNLPENTTDGYQQDEGEE